MQNHGPSEEMSTGVETSEVLQEKAIMFLSGEIDDSHLEICNRLLSYHFDPEFDGEITLLINSPGGIVSAGWAIVDTMNFVRCRVNTVALGTVASMATDIFVNGDHRTCSEHATILIHPHSASRWGSHNQLIASNKMDNIEHTKRLNHYLRNSKYKTVNQTEKHLFNTRGDDLWLSPEEMLEHGLCDVIAKTDRAKRRKSFK